MDSQAEQRFKALKVKLDALHYFQPLTIESTALVEKLFNDFIKTTEAFKRVSDDKLDLKRRLE